MDFYEIILQQKLAGGGGDEPVIEALSVTENGTYTAPSGVDGYSPVTVNVSGGGGGLNLQAIAHSANIYNSDSGVMPFDDYSLTISKTGTYTVYWTASKGGTSKAGIQLYINGAAYGEEQQSFESDSRDQVRTMNAVALNQGDTVALYGKSFAYNSTQGVFAHCLIIIEEAPSS